jgi:hypothetical protein
MDTATATQIPLSPTSQKAWDAIEASVAASIAASPGRQATIAHVETLLADIHNGSRNFKGAATFFQGVKASQAPGAVTVATLGRRGTIKETTTVTTDDFDAQVATIPLGAKPISDAQRRFLDFLLAKMDTAGTDFVAQAAVAVTTRQASAIIDALKILPAKPVAAPAPRADAASVPDGKYALVGEDGILRFYQVDNVTSGKWAGWTFVKVQAGSDYFPIKGNAKTAILAKIAADPKAAMARYGHELGHCGKCGRELTNPESILAGLGPICAGRLGW